MYLFRFKKICFVADSGNGGHKCIQIYDIFALHERRIRSFVNQGKCELHRISYIKVVQSTKTSPTPSWLLSKHMKQVIVNFDGVGRYSFFIIFFIFVDELPILLLYANLQMDWRDSIRHYLMRRSWNVNWTSDHVYRPRRYKLFQAGLAGLK